jgi:predicted enzyme related to lactoylglutathione lyase
VESSSVTAVLFAMDLKRVATFYAQVLGMYCIAADESHQALVGSGFHLHVQQIPQQGAQEIAAEQLPQRRIWGAIRLNFPVQNIEYSRRVARSLDGEVDSDPPGWADRNANFFLGYDPEGNVFGVCQHVHQ